MPKIRAATVAEHRTLVWGEILDAFDALLEERGYDGVTLPEVAVRAGIARNTIYNYADGTAALLAAAAQRSATVLSGELAAVAEDSSASARDRITMIVHLLLESYARDTRAILLSRFRSSIASQEDVEPFLGLITRIGSIVTAGVSAGEFAEVDNVDATVELMVGCVAAAVEHVLDAPEDAPAMARNTTRFLLAALGARCFT